MSVVKKIFFSIGAISLLSLAVTLVGVGGGWVISNIPWYFAWVVPVVIASFVFSVGVIMLRSVNKAERLKNEFITIAAHRLRTPLSRIQWGIEEVKGEVAEGGRDLLTNIDDTTKDLIGLVNYLLDATEANKRSLYYDYIFEEGGFDQIVQQVIADYSVRIGQKDLNVRVSIEEGIPKTYLDKDRMKVAVGVFIENAIIYTPKNGTIDIEVRLENNMIVFSVKDTGIGISKEAMPSVFSKFFRSKDAVAASPDHIGLGLFIAKEIIRKHRGRVYVESQGKDQGSHFWFLLPLS